MRVIIAERDWRGAVQAVFRPDQRSPLAGQCNTESDDVLLNHSWFTLAMARQRGVTSTSAPMPISVSPGLVKFDWP